MNRRFLVALPLAGIVLGAAVACGPSSSDPVSVPSTFGPSYTQQASAAASDAAQLAVKCQPKGDSTQAWEAALLLHKSARQDFYSCEKVPRADDDAVAACALSAAENAHKASGTSTSRETGFLNALASCVDHLGATASPSPSASASR